MISTDKIRSIRSGVLIVGHGTRDPAGRAEFQQTVDAVRLRLAEPAEGCFLELAEPDIAVGVQRLVTAGVRQIVALPLLLFAAGHAKQDIPAALAAAAEAQPGVTIWQADSLECHRAILQASAEQFRAALRAAAQGAGNDRSRALDEAENIHWLLVGRGSSDPTAIEKVRQFAAARLALTPGIRASVAFVAAAQPRLPVELARLATSSARRIVVQPHLLFYGEVLREIVAAVEAAARFAEANQAGGPNGGVAPRWHVTAHLGPSDLLVEAVLDRIAAARIPSNLASR
ncbi:MAG TPA: CbiX/SirB N-terminal domain-containing protein [Pirellulales bacterium]|jgi:sirohydrochlorin cobaltochelatase|nr:CbiX/SirB N-terminal domain-containing protein [Pirellulales bacterium]